MEEYFYNSNYQPVEDEEDKCAKLPMGNITIPESDESSSDETLHSGDQQIPQELPQPPITPLMDHEASTTPDLSDAEESNYGINTDNQKTVNTEDDIHECYTFSSCVAKALCKIERNRRHKCMHKIMHLLMESCKGGE